MSLQERVEELEGNWTDTDRRLIETLFARPRESAFLSTNELAKRARVHPASAVRFARKLGFEGYPPLRAQLQMEVFGASEAAERMRRRIERLGEGSVLKTLVETEVGLLRRLTEQVADADILVAARAVADAQQTFVFAVGHAVSLSHLLEARLGRLGHRTVALNPVARDMAVDLLQAGAGDSFILFALNDVHPLVARIIEHARGVRAKIVVISDLPGLALAPRPDVVLAATRGAENAPRSLTVPMTICNALVLHVSRLKQRVTIRNLGTLDRIRKQLAAP